MKLHAIDNLDVWVGAKTAKRGRGRSSNSKKTNIGLEKLRTFICELAINGSLIETSGPWLNVSLEDLGEIKSGNSLTKSVKKSKFSSGIGRPYLATADVGYGFEELNYETGVNIPDDNQDLKIALEGSILICSEGGSAGRKCGITNRDISFGNKLYALSPVSGVSVKFKIESTECKIIGTPVDKSRIEVHGGSNFSHDCKLTN